jgi:hypothetical protein
MKITYSSRNGRLAVEIQADTQKDLFQQISSFQEVFDETACGACQNTDLRFVVRNVDDNDFFELHCLNTSCRHRLAFGQHKKGGSLFPSRKDKDGKWLPKNGWTKWNPDTKKEE